MPGREALGCPGYKISRNQLWKYRMGITRRSGACPDPANPGRGGHGDGPVPGSDVEEGTRRLIESVIMEAFLDAPTVQVQSITDLGKLTLAHAR